MKVNKIATISLFALSMIAVSNPVLSAVSGAAGTTSGAALSFEQIKGAAQNGDADAQYALGYMYYYGKSGAPKDPMAAKNWIGKAAAQKQPQAMKALDLMNKQSVEVTAQQTSGQSTPPTTQQATPTSYAPQQQRSAPATQQQSNFAPQTQTPHVMNSTNSERMHTSKNFVDNTTINSRASHKESDLREKLSQENKETLVDMRDQTKETLRHAVASNSSDEDNASNDNNEPKSGKSNLTQSGNYTLQLLGSYHKDLVVKELKAKHLDGKASIYQTKHNDKDWFVLLYGRYESPNEARDFAKTLEGRMDVKPWVKPVSTISTYKKLK
jgi:septal ring-binding cell division protein DamX